MVATGIQKVVEPPNLTNRPEWKVSRVAEAKAPSDLTVTHVNQTYNLWVSIFSLGIDVLLLLKLKEAML